MQCTVWAGAASEPDNKPVRGASFFKCIPRLLRAALSVTLASWLLIYSLCGPAAAAERVSVTEAALAVSGQEPEASLTLNAQFDFELPWTLEDAVARGIALYFVVEFELFRERWYWFDKRMVSTSLTYRLTYSPLTRQYRLARGALAVPFDSLAEALAAIRRVRGWTVLERGSINAHDDYRAQVRLRLDTSQLPKPFQVNAITNRDWALSSDWHEIKITPDTNQ